MKPGTCIHFNGIGLTDVDKCCERGINYRQAFDGSRPAIMLRLPCIQFHILPAHGRGTYIAPGEATVRKEIDRRGETMVACPHYQEPTDEQVEQSRKESQASIKRTVAALTVAAKWRLPHPQTDRRAVVECPICEGRLHLAQYAHNGHVHGRCETQGCVQWME